MSEFTAITSQEPLDAVIGDRLKRSEEKWAKKFEPEMEKSYLDAAKNRKDLMNKYLFNKEDGLYYDYNYVRNEIQDNENDFDKDCNSSNSLVI